MNACAIDNAKASFYLLGLACAMLGTALTFATFLSRKRIEQVGLRPKGCGLWTWLVGYLTQGVGVYGYDVVLGVLSPPLRLLCHMAAIFVLWGGMLFLGRHRLEILPRDTPKDCFCEVPAAVWRTGMISTVLYLLTCCLLQYMLPCVSLPGGPRQFKLERDPCWEDVTTCSKAQEWKCLVAEESHENTHSKFPGETITGEAFGRQIWSQVDSNLYKEQIQQDVQHIILGKSSKHFSRGTDMDDELIKTMAKGGRDEFGFNPSKNPNGCDMWFRAQQIRKYIQAGKKPPSTDPPKLVREATHKAAHFYSMLQCEDGHWAGDHAGPHFLIPGLVTAWYVMGQPRQFLNEGQVELLKHYVLVHQQSDGGWGTHIESPSTMFGSALMYVTLRLLGVSKDDSASVKGRKFLKDNGGVLYASSWSKFYLCLLGLMDWKGHNSVPSEMWLLPNWFPFHPGRMWCHARMVYLPMGYLYGKRFVYDKAETDPVIRSLRDEIYCEPYNSIPWMKTRHWVAPMDNYSPIHWVMKTFQNLLARYENWFIFQPFKSFVRRKGLEFSLKYIKAEDIQTNYIDIGPVNKALNMISQYYASGGDLSAPEVVMHMMRVQDYLWVAEDGMKVQGYNGSQCWDTSLCAQALYESGLLDEFPEMSRKIWAYLERTQILSTEVAKASPAYHYESNGFRSKLYRHVSEGGWPFSSSAHGWPVTDCTSEGLKACICLLKSKSVQEGLRDGTLKNVTDERMFKAANVLLTYQNEDGGWATYENNRGWGWYEKLNPSEVFGDIMIDYSYVECSASVLTALVDFREMYPKHRIDDIQHSIDKGVAFLKNIQKNDGSWYGSWACCFTYGIWFGIEGLVKCGEPLDSPCILKACEFLLKYQRPNGGWGEDFTSCYNKDFAMEGMKAYGDDGSGIVNTSWALLALSIAKCKDIDAIRNGVQYLKKRQLPCGDWPQEGISGVFNRSVGITFTSYRNVFPIWAMGRCNKTYGRDIDNSFELRESIDPSTHGL